MIRFKQTLFVAALAFGTLVCTHVSAQNIQNIYDCQNRYVTGLKACSDAKKTCVMTCPPGPNHDTCTAQCGTDHQFCTFDVSWGIGFYPPAFSPCLFDAVAFNLVEPDLSHQWNICMSNCTSARNHCFTKGNELNPKPANWDNDCWDQSFTCQFECDAEFPATTW